MGIITAHYGVEGGAFYGIPLLAYMPLGAPGTRDTHLGILWIANT